MPQSTDGNTETIILRVPENLKTELQKMADQDFRKLSDYIRLQLTKLVNDTKKKN